jgi:hypothetical protein
MNFATVEEAVAWVRQLDGLLWKEETRGYAERTRGESPTFWSARRRMGKDELQTLLDIVTTWALPVSMVSANFGFNVGMQVWSPEPAALSPGVEVMPERLTLIGPEHLPLSEARKMKDRILFADAWRFFSQYTHTDANRELLRRCSLPAPPTEAEMAY